MKKVFLLVVAVLVLPTTSVRAQSLEPVGSYTADARAARLSELRIQFAERISDSQIARVSAGCSKVKEKLLSLKQTVTASTEVRLDTYETTITTLSSLRALAATKSVDASSLELLIVDFQRAELDFEVASTQYLTAIDDSLSVDCRTEPVLFIASVNGIRIGQTKTLEAADAITSLTKLSLPSALDTLSRKLKARE